MNQKPISMIINETHLSLVDICNKSGLPVCILESIVKSLYDEIVHLAVVQLKQDEEAYANILKDTHKKGDNQLTE